MKKILIAFIAFLAVTGLGAQGVKPLPSLHVEGKWITDKHGNHVVLHGVMDTPSAWFNEGRWGWSYDDSGRRRCLEYFEKLFWGLEQAKCDVFRLHLEPAWTNDNTQGYKYEGSTGQPSDATGEADISKFNPKRLTTYLKTLYFPLAKKAMNHGMFVVMRPPGVCPQNLKVGDYYQQYLLTVWDIVTQNDSIRKYAGQISIELANEPVNVRNKYNQDDKKALHDYFQPIADKIRENGFTGIIWVPGTGWQSNYTSYASYPITGYNIGYAVHDYDGWYGCEDKKLTESNVAQAAKNKIAQFRNQVPVVNTNPIIITEVDWSPTKPGTGHYNEHGTWVESNYGTWATGRTSMWGRCYKAVLDNYKNISMTLSGTACLIDIDELINNNNVVPAFGGLEEACGKACMDWYAEYYKVDWPHADVQEGTEEYETAQVLKMPEPITLMEVGETAVPQFWATFLDNHESNVTSEVSLVSNAPEVVAVSGGTLKAVGWGTADIVASFTDPRNGVVEHQFTVNTSFFPFDDRYVNANLDGEGKFNAKMQAIKPSAEGQVGWEYPSLIDLSSYRYLVIKLRQAQACNAHLNIYTSHTIQGDCFSSEPFGSSLMVTIDLQEARYTTGEKQGQLLDRKNIGIISFWGNGNGMLQIDDIYPTNDGENFEPQPMAVSTVLMPCKDKVNVYTLSGQIVRRRPDRQQAVAGLPKGVYVIENRKVVVK